MSSLIFACFISKFLCLCSARMWSSGSDSSNGHSWTAALFMETVHRKKWIVINAFLIWFKEFDLCWVWIWQFFFFFDLPNRFDPFGFVFWLLYFQFIHFRKLCIRWYDVNAFWFARLFSNQQLLQWYDASLGVGRKKCILLILLLQKEQTIG